MYNGRGCSWQYSGSTTQGAGLTLECTGTQGDLHASEPWDGMDKVTCFKYVKTVTMTNIGRLNGETFRGSKTLQTLDLSRCTQLTDLPDNLCEGCEKLTSIKLPASITSIGNRAFFGCSSLKMSLTVSEDFKAIGDSAFEGSGITSVDASAVTKEATIGSRVFARCKELTDVTLPTMPIPDSMFEECTKLSKIDLVPMGILDYVGNRAFFGCSSLKTAPSLQLVKTVGDSAFEGTGFEEFNIANVGTQLGQDVAITFGTRMLASCTSLTKFIFSGRFLNVSDGTFDGCSKLSTVIGIPMDLESIGSRTFYGCSSWVVNLTAPPSLKSIGESAFEGSGVEYLNASLAPDLQIGARAFANCDGLTTVELPENMQTIPDGLFDGCSKLSIVENLPMNPTSIGERAFYGCEKLALDFASPASLNSIGDLAFAGSGITSFDASKIASGVTLATFTLGTNVFASCKDLTTVKFSSQMVNLPEGTFDGCTNLKTLENLPAFVTIGKMAFANCSSLSMELQAPASLTSIGESAFEGSAITSVDTENTKCTFGARAFARCPSLTEFVFPSEIRSLPEYLFTESGLTLIVIPESVTEIGTGCFEDCKSLTNVTYLGKSEISNDIFSGCDNLTVVSVPDDYPYGSFGGHDLGKGSPGLSDAAKIGIGVGVAAAVVIIVVIVVVIVLRRKSGGKPADDNMVSA